LSYQGLDDESRRLFRLLALFEMPDFDGQLAAAVVQAPLHWAVDALEALVDDHLLTSAGTDAAGQRRYRFHDLVRLYARRRAELEDSDDTRALAYSRGVAVTGRPWVAA
jgi:hypothetical protein